MPVARYYKGHGRTVMRAMTKRYGKKQGKQVFYATVNKMRRGSAKQRAAQPRTAPGAKRR